MQMYRGKSLKALTYDVSEGFAAINPIFLKAMDPESLRDFYKELSKTQMQIRASKFPTHDIPAIRTRNLRLQRLYSATIVVRNFARERKIQLV